MEVLKIRAGTWPSLVSVVFAMACGNDGVLDAGEPDLCELFMPPSLLVEVVDAQGRPAAIGAILTVINERVSSFTEGYLDPLILPANTGKRDGTFEVRVRKPWYEDFLLQDVLIPANCGDLEAEGITLRATLSLLPDAPAVRQVVLPPHDFRIARSLCGMRREIDGHVFAEDDVSHEILWETRDPKLLTIERGPTLGEGHHRAWLVPPCPATAGKSTYVVGISRADPSVRDSIEVEIY